jgi:teichuronic acid biosynthesis glycosyltransferase TuaG
MVLVSVVMSSYNHAKYLPEAIESVLKQTFSDFELIIVDDCSTDNSKAIIESYQAKDIRVKPFFHEKNLGIAITANDSLKSSSGKFIAFLSSDDIWMPNKLARQLQILKHNENKIVWAEGEVIDGNGALVGLKVTTRMSVPIHRRSGNLFQELLKEDIIFGQTAIMKRDFVSKVIFNDNFRYVNDHLFFVELARIHEFIFIDEPLAKYRVHGDNVSLTNQALWNKEKLLIRKHFLEKYLSEIAPEVLSDIYYKMAHSYSGLGDKKSARQYYLKAIHAAPFHANSALFLILALTNGNGFLGKLLPNYYYKVISRLSF